MNKLLCSFLALIFLVSCTNSYRVDGREKINVEYLNNTLLGKNINEVRQDNNLNIFELTDTIIESEGYNWKAVSVKKQGDQLLIIESNYNSELITRVSILSNKIDTSVYSTFDLLKSKIDSTRLNESPDGYLIFFDYKIKNLSYIMNIPIDHELTKKEIRLNNIPDTLRVARSILLLTDETHNK